MGELKRRTPPTAFEPDDGKRLKRFRRMLLDDCKKDAVLNVNGVRVPVHHEVLVASSPVLALLGHNIPITGSSVEAVRHFVGYLYGFNVFEDGDLSVEEALELADLFIQFDIDAAAMKAARYCLQKSTPGHLNKLCRVLGRVKEIRTELAKKVVDNHDCVDLSLVDKATMYLVLTSLRLTELQKLVAVGKWTKLNSKNGLMKQLFGTIDLEYAGQCVKEMDERLMHKNWRINTLQGKLSTEEEQNEALAVKVKEGKEKINALTIALKEKEKEVIALQSSHERELCRLKLALSRRDSGDSREPSISRITQAHENTTTTTDKNPVKSLSIPPKKRMLDAELGNKAGSVEDLPSAKNVESPETNEVMSDSVRAEENGATHSLFKVNDEDVTKNSSEMNALAKEILSVQAVPHCYEVLAPSSSEDNDSDYGNDAQNEVHEDSDSVSCSSSDFGQPGSEGEFDDTFDEIDNIEVSKPKENTSDVRNTTNETPDKEGVGADDSEESRRKETRPSSLSEPFESGSARCGGPVWFSDYVSKLQLEWEHPTGGQAETIMLHQVRAIIELRSMTQKSFAKESGISQSSASLYLRGKHRGNLQKVEEKLAIFVQKYLEENAGVNPEVPSNIVAAPWINTEIPVLKSPARAAGEGDEQENQSDGPENTKQRTSMPPLPSPSYVPVLFPPLEKFRKPAELERIRSSPLNDFVNGMREVYLFCAVDLLTRRLWLTRDINLPALPVENTD